MLQVSFLPEYVVESAMKLNVVLCASYTVMFNISNVQIMQIIFYIVVFLKFPLLVQCFFYAGNLQHAQR